MNEPLIACYLKVKRKTFWVYRWMEIDPDGILKYRSKKEDKLNKIELKLTECKINEVQSPDGSTVEIMPKGGEKIKFMANTPTEHKKIVQAIINLRKPPESVKQSIEIQNPQKKLNPQIIEEQQYKLVPDQKLITNTSDQLKLATQIYIKDFQNLYVHKVYDDVWQYQFMKVMKQNQNAFILKLTEMFNQEIQNQGLPLFLAISTIFFLLITIVVYLMISFFEATPMFYSFTMTLNLIAFPFALKFLTKVKQREVVTHSMSKTFLKVDFNGLIFILTSQNLKPQWCPNITSFNDGITYKDGSREIFSVNVYIESETAYVIENKGSTIYRVYEIINQSEELVLVKYYTKQNLSRKNLFCLKGFVKQQLMNPKSPLLEYLQIRNYQSYNQSEILYRVDNDQFRQSAVQKPSSPLSVVQEQLIEQRPAVSQVQSQVQQQFQQSQMQPVQQQAQGENQINEIKDEIQIPAKFAHYVPITLKAREFLLNTYPISPAWQLQASHNGFVIHTRTDQETGLTLSRGEGIIPYQMEEVYDIIQKVDKRGDYDGLFDTGQYLVKLSEDIALIYQKFKTIKIVVASRDFCMITRIFREGDRWVIIAKSVEYPECPPTKSIRGDTVAGWILERVGDKTKACFITMVDPKGNIPAAIVASSAKVQGECVEKIKNLLDKRKK